jgi:hypothetical protein
MDLNDDSENDSDYVPEEEVDGKKVSSKGEAVALDIASGKRKRKVQAIWDEIQVQDQTFITSKLQASNLQYSDPLFERPSKKMRLRIRRFFRLLQTGTKGGLGPDIYRKTQNQISHEDASSKSINIKKTLMSSLQNVKRKTVVTESRKFAGEAVT